MSMELGATKWTSNTPRPFARAPGAGLGAARWTSTVPTPFGPAPGGGSMGGMYDSGFAATPQSIDMDAERILAKGPFSVKKEPIAGSDIPSMVIRFRYTDRGALTKGQLDTRVKAFLKKAGFKVSKASSFKPVNVAWKWGTMGAEAAGDVPLYVPVVASPPAYEGLRYAGAVFGEPLYAPDAKALEPMPNQIWVYTVAITSAADTMSDGESAQALTLLKQAMINMAPANAYGTVLATVRGCPRDVFGKKPEVTLAKAGWSSLILYVAYNVLSLHVGSEVL